MTETDRQAIAQAAAAISQQTGLRPTIGIVLGSGLGGLSASIEQPVIIPYGRIPHFVPSTVEGHKGNLVIGRLGKQTVAVMDGRLHFYEGYSLQQVTFPIRVLRELRCTTLIMTNAAGGLNPSFRVGDLMLITDHINLPGLAGNNPLFGPNDPNLGPRFPDMHNAYDSSLRALAASVARDLGYSLREGVYVMLGGPSFETPAEVAFLRAMGADAVGMSTAPEVVVARHGGMRVLGLSMISNMLSPSPESAPVNHEEVLAAGAEGVKRLVPLITRIVERLQPQVE
jgi:purine-nucleoside phosphorylase